MRSSSHFDHPSTPVFLSFNVTEVTPCWLYSYWSLLDHGGAGGRRFWQVGIKHWDDPTINPRLLIMQKHCAPRHHSVLYHWVFMLFITGIRRSISHVQFRGEHPAATGPKRQRVHSIFIFIGIVLLTFMTLVIVFVQGFIQFYIAKRAASATARNAGN